MRPCPGRPTCLPTGPCAQRLTWGWSRVGAQGTGYPGACSRRVGRASPGIQSGHHRCSLMPVQPLGTPRAMGLGEDRATWPGLPGSLQPTSSVDGGGRGYLMPGTQPGGPADQLAAPGLREAPGSLPSPRPCVPAWPLFAAPSPRAVVWPPASLRGHCLPLSPSLPSSGLLPDWPTSHPSLPPAACSPAAVLLFPGWAQC